MNYFSQAASPDTLELDRRLQTHYKQVFASIFIPAIVTMSLFIVIAHWRFDAKFYWGLATVVFIVVFNGSMTLQARKIQTKWGSFDSRADRLDMFRWLVNYPVDIAMFWFLEMSPAAIVVAWTIVTFGALTDVHERRYKIVTVVGAVLSFIVMITQVVDIPSGDQLFLLTCYIGIIFIFWRLESSMAREMREYLSERLHRNKAEAQALAMARDAAVGKSVRSLTHELNNLSALARISVDQLRDVPNEKQAAVSRLDRSLELITRMSCLVLDDIGGYCATIRSSTLAQLHDDILLLMRGLLAQSPIQLAIDFPENSHHISYVERSGSTYLILHNLVLNSSDAIKAKFGNSEGGRISLTAELDEEAVRIRVRDNGIGIPEDRIAAVVCGEASSSKPNGHGIGMKFVADECWENSFELTLESLPGVHTTFTLAIPRT